MQSWGNATWHGPKWSNQEHWVGVLGESRRKLKGGVPKQPWHKADGSLSGSDMTRLCGLQPLPPPPIPNKSVSSLADVQQRAPPCQRAPAPKQTPDCNLTPPPQHQLAHLDCETLAEPDSSWKQPNWWLSVCMFNYPFQRDTTSWFEHGVNRTRVYT